MKTSLSLCAIVLCASTVFPQAVNLPSVAPLSVQSTPPTITDAGANHRVWQSVNSQIMESGAIVVHTNQYLELQTGLYFRDEATGQWMESQELITPYPSGSIAQFGQYKVIWANNINSIDAIDLLSPDGKRFKSHFFGVAYYEKGTGKSVLLAEVKDSTGEILPPNQVIYRDAADGLALDVRYVYQRDAFHQDILLREAPPRPEEYGLDSAQTELAVLTEFVEAPPVEKAGPLTDTVSDAEINFGAMEFGYGKAFLLGDSANAQTSVSRKEWSKVEGRQFLIEKIDFSDVDESLKTLPPSQQASAPFLQRKVVEGRHLPARLFAKSVQRPMLQATRQLASKGFLFDYYSVITTANFVFTNSQCYYVSGSVNLSGRTTFEGGAVIKFASSTSAQVTISGLVDCQAALYQPLILTAKDDDTIGEIISGSTGTPTGPSYGSGFAINSTGNRLDNVRFSYGATGIVFNASGGQLDLANVQFVKCGTPFVAKNNTLKVCNALFVEPKLLVSGLTSSILLGQHWTVHNCTNFSDASSSVSLTNSLIAGSPSFAWGPAVKTLVTTIQTNDSGVFQQMGAAGHYLADNSPYRNAGTYNLDPVVQARIGKLTTAPPLSHDASFSVDEVLSPQAPRDNDMFPDLGYHYPPIDWVVNNRTVSATLILTNGVVLAHYSGYGLRIDANGKLISEGLPGTLNEIVRYNAVQEQSNPNWSQTGWFGAIVPAFTSAGATPEVRLRFTDIPALPGNNHSFWSDTPGVFAFTDSQFHGGNIYIYSPGVGRSVLLNVTNCLYERVQQLVTQSGSDPITALFYNDLFFSGTLNMFNSGSQAAAWRIYDSLFDTVNLYQNGYAITNGYNAYVSTTPLTPVFAGNQTPTTANYQAGPLGRYYLPLSSSLLNAGSRTADAAGLYQYSATADQSKSGKAGVDIGFHYVALGDAYLLSTVPDKSLVGFWKLDETNGTSAGDSSGNAFNGSLTGGASWISGQVGGAASFDGVNGKISVSSASALQLSGDMTLALWVRKTATPGNWAELVGKANTFSVPNYRMNYELLVASGTSKQVLFQQVNSGTELDLMSKASLETGVWYHVAVTIKGSIASIYINGNLDNTELVPGPGGITTDPVTFGYNGVHNYFQGNLDDVRIYNRALAANEIANLYAQRGLVAYWKLNDGTGTSTMDSSGNNHIGSFVNSPSWTVGQRGGALSFDGSSAHVTSPASADLNLTNDLSIAFWTKPNSSWPANEWARLVGKGDLYNRPYGIWTDPSQKFLFQRHCSSGPDNLYSQTQIIPGNWYHVIGIVQGSRTYLYINGSLDASMSNCGASTPSSAAQTLGFALYYQYYNGVLDDVRIYNRAINEAEIQTLYNQRGLVSHWKMDEGTGTQITDSSDNNHSGTFGSGVSWTTGPVGGALNFEPTGSASVTNAPDLQLPGDLTISCWVRKNVAANIFPRLLGKGNSSTNQNYAIWFEPASTGRRVLFHQDIVDSSTVNLYSLSPFDPGIWNHVAAVVNGSSASLYVNGRRENSAIRSGNAVTPTDPLTLGYAGFFDYLSGALDDVRIYNRALSSGEIASIVSSGPRDTDGDGIPDYMEDRNGDGQVSLGETDSRDPLDQGVKVKILAPRSNSNLP